jgi:hypothetical protein
MGVSFKVAESEAFSKIEWNEKLHRGASVLVLRVLFVYDIEQASRIHSYFHSHIKLQYE